MLRERTDLSEFVGVKTRWLPSKHPCTAANLSKHQLSFALISYRRNTQFEDLSAYVCIQDEIQDNEDTATRVKLQEKFFHRIVVSTCFFFSQDVKCVPMYKVLQQMNKDVWE